MFTEENMPYTIVSNQMGNTTKCYSVNFQVYYVLLYNLHSSPCIELVSILKKTLSLTLQPDPPQACNILSNKLMTTLAAEYLTCHSQCKYFSLEQQCMINCLSLFKCRKIMQVLISIKLRCKNILHEINDNCIWNKDS